MYASLIRGPKQQAQRNILTNHSSRCCFSHSNIFYSCKLGALHCIIKTCRPRSLPYPDFSTIRTTRNTRLTPSSLTLSSHFKHLSSPLKDLNSSFPLSDVIPPAYNEYLQCASPRTRHEIRQMTDHDWNAFVIALHAMRRRPSLMDPSVNQFEYLARIHSRFSLEAHGGAFFPLWHRLYLLLFENLLRREDPTVSVPYWNWSMEATDPAMSSIWKRVGGAVLDSDGEPACIPFAPFHNIQTNLTVPHCVSRGFISGKSGSIPSFVNSLAIEALIQNDVPYSKFTTALEFAHNYPHRGIGGDMKNSSTASNDPIFYLHHAFLDNIFLKWQHNGHGSPGRFGGKNPSVTGTVNRNSTLQAFQRSVRYSQTLDCVRYAPFSGLLANSSGQMNLSVNIQPDFFMNETFVNRSRAEEGRSILQGMLIQHLTRKIYVS